MISHGSEQFAPPRISVAAEGSAITRFHLWIFQANDACCFRVRVSLAKSPSPLPFLLLFGLCLGRRRTCIIYRMF